MNEAAGQRMSGRAVVAYSLPQVGINLMGALFGQWLQYLYRPPAGDSRPALVGAFAFATVMLLGRIIDGVTDPLVGYLSDRTRSRLGRRIPWILYGTLPLALTYAAIWFPPTATESVANAVFLGVVLALYWVFFTIVLGPYSALLPEIASTSDDRVRLSSAMALFTVAGILLGLAAGPLQSAFPNGMTIAGLHIPTGLQVAGLASTFIFVVTMLATPLGVRELPHAPNKEVPPGLIAGVLSAFKNPAFLAFLGLAVFVQLGSQVFMVGLPYLASQILERAPGEPGLVAAGQGEAWTGGLQGVLILTALCFLPAIRPLVARWGKRRLMVAATGLFAVALALVPVITLAPDPAIPMVAACVLLGLPVSCVLVVVNAVGADVVDYDEKLTGLRREGLYSGASAFIAKSALGLSNSIVLLALLLGDSREHPLGILLLGPIAAVLVALGTWIYSRSPVD
ncbi:MAG: MFS transporter [Myxococcales bacterium]|nr:MFS transporter [Myxococcales bacterium]MCB9519736.1 MFS transporter [Myxococcales bacterium]MCB9530427.1 MFS transporter [Myxococcales bacterium]MCB9533674.1 MFS transporter [Myxococcales bacterium]